MIQEAKKRERNALPEVKCEVSGIRNKKQIKKVQTARLSLLLNAGSDSRQPSLIPPNMAQGMVAEGMGEAGAEGVEGEAGGEGDQYREGLAVWIMLLGDWERLFVSVRAVVL